MSQNEKLFSLMAQKMYDLTFDENVKPNDEDISKIFEVLSWLIGKKERTTSCVNVAAAALGVAGGEFSNDMGYYICERSDSFDYLLDAMVECDVLERLNGDNHTAYIRI